MRDADGLTRPATIDDVRLLAAFVAQRCHDLDVPAAAMIDLELAFVEAANNVALHGYDDASRGTFTVRVRPVTAGIEIDLEDEGKALPGGVLQGRGTSSLLAESGRGLGLIAACVDRVDYRTDPPRNILTLFKAFTA